MEQAANLQKNLAEGLPGDNEILQGNIREDGKIDFDKILQAKLAKK